MLERACYFPHVSVLVFACRVGCSRVRVRAGVLGVLGVLACWRVGRVGVLSVLGAILSRSISDRPPEITSVICQLRLTMLMAAVCDISGRVEAVCW